MKRRGKRERKPKRALVATPTMTFHAASEAHARKGGGGTDHTHDDEGAGDDTVSEAAAHGTAAKKQRMAVSRKPANNKVAPAACPLAALLP